MLERLLKQDGLVCDIAASAAVAKELLNRNSYVVLLLDLGLPDRDGLEMIHELKADHNTADLPIIVVSARADEGRAAFSGVGFEVVDWIQKPVDEDRLMNSLRQVLISKGGWRVLHVEDELDVVEIVRELLRDPGYLRFCAQPGFRTCQIKRERV